MKKSGYLIVTKPRIINKNETCVNKLQLQIKKKNRLKKIANQKTVSSYFIQNYIKIPNSNTKFMTINKTKESNIKNQL